jgi:hypothetical protein
MGSNKNEILCFRTMNSRVAQQWLSNLIFDGSRLIDAGFASTSDI